MTERRGVTEHKRPQGHLIWIHAVSVGESFIALTLIERIIQTIPAAQILVTTGTVTAARLMATRLPPQAFHQFAPLDHPTYIARFLGHWHPDCALMVESELWPNLIRQTAERGIPLALINARMSDASYTAWRRWPRTISFLFSQFDLCLAQDRRSADRLQKLGAGTTQVIGNLKFSAPALPVDATTFECVQSQVGTRPLWLAASTHPGEEKIVAAVHKILRDHMPGLLTIIAPRHPERGAEIQKLLEVEGLLTALRSKGADIDRTTDIYIADTMGELGLLYRLAPAAFIGGSLVPHGGQNPLEPARLDCAIVHGPHVFNFADIYRDLESRKASILVSNSRDLTETIRHLLENEDARLAHITASEARLKEADDVIERYFQALRPLLPSPTSTRSASDARA